MCRAHCLWKLWFDILKLHLQTVMSFSSFLAIFPLRPEYTQGFFCLGKEPEEKETLRLNQLAISFLKNDKVFNSASPLDKYTQEYQYKKKKYEKPEDHFRISQCLPAFFLLLKVRRWQWKVAGGWYFVLKINHYLTFITSQNPFNINRWTKLFLNSSLIIGHLISSVQWVAWLAFLGIRSTVQPHISQNIYFCHYAFSLTYTYVSIPVAWNSDVEKKSLIVSTVVVIRGHTLTGSTFCGVL